MSQLVTVHLWTVPAVGVPAAVARVALDRRPLAGTPGLTFAKLVGTGDGHTMRARDADLRCWGLVAAWESPGALARFERVSRVARAWADLATERCRLDLVCSRSRGRWSGQVPFRPDPTAAGDGPVAAITRARLRPGRALRFWRAVPPVVADLAQQDGLLRAIGIGEAPVGFQGTLSLWRDAAALTSFAYARPAHRAVVERTPAERWYAEELFARFAVRQVTGTLHGRPLLP